MGSLTGVAESAELASSSALVLKFSRSTSF